MPIETNLSVAPYFDDHDPDKKYVKILTQPKVSVQVRELNNLSTLVQEQIERLSNNLFKRGTIIDGCNFVFYPEYPYVKILDQQIDGATAVASLYEGAYIKNSSNLVALVIDSYDGFESTDPDLKTLYVKYLNSGSSGNTSKFASGQALTVYDANNGVQKVTITNGGTQFSNADTLLFVSAFDVNVTSGSFTAGDIITQVNDTYTAYAEILEVNTTIVPAKTILKIKPREADLCNASINALSWTFLASGSVANGSSVGDIGKFYGTGARAEIVTNGSGKITQIAMQTTGEDYDVDPHITVKTKESRVSLGSLSLSAQTYICQLRVASVVNSVGNGYAFGISEGLIYQKGYFLQVDPQTIIVEKYNENPNNVSVVFETVEEIIDSNEDPGLLDNAIGTPNHNAPGAHRLKMTPTLAVINTDSITGNDDVFPICEWSEGQPYKQNQKTSYDAIGDEIAEGIHDSHGDFVVDRFLVTTRHTANDDIDANTVAIVVDPGIAYVQGQKVQTMRNFVIEVDKGIDTAIKANTYISLNYGNYVKVNELAGVFQFDTADSVSLRSVAGEYVSNTAKVFTGTISGPGGSGAEIGTARIRSLILDEGIPGTASAIYYLYLFDVDMDSGKNFNDVRSIFYNGAGFKGVCDVVLTPDATSGSNIAKLEGTTNDKLLFYCGFDSPKNANQITYQYRTLSQSAKMNNTGVATVTLAATEEYFPYAGELSDAQETDVIVIPTGSHLYGATQFTGTVTANTSNTRLIGSGTSLLGDVIAGDYVYLTGNSSQEDIKRVEKVVNNTLIILDTAPSFTNTTAKASICFPQYLPIPINERTGYTANISSDQKSLSVYLNMDLTASGNSNVAIAYNVERRNVDQTDKTVKRNILTKIRCNTHSQGTSGPWCLGVPDIIRLNAVYTENSLSVSDSSTNITKHFYIDHNQTPNYYGLGYLYLDPYADVNLDEDAVLLVQYDALTTAGDGFSTIASYVSTNTATLYINDSSALGTATNYINTLEIPEMYDAKGKSYDLIDYFDFRPRVSNTANLSLTTGGATINPAETVSFGNTADPANNKKFPVPDAILSANIEVWLGRTDAVFLHKDGKITVERGKPGTKKVAKTPEEAMLLNTVIIPPYPSLPKKISVRTSNILRRNIANERKSNKRISDKQIETDITSDNEFALHQPKVYTFSEIGGLERRIEDLEYYTALSLLEASMKDKVITGGDNSSERFKFGFFIDDFSTMNFIDTDNPEHAADIDNARVVPDQESINVEHIFDEDAYTFEHKLLLSQKQATVKKPTTPGTVNTEIVSVYAKQKDKHKLAKNDKPFAEPPITVTMSTVAANSTIWFHMMDGADEVFLYQGTTVIASGDDVQQITDAEKAALLKDDFFRTNTGGPGGINDELDNGSNSGSAGDDKVRKAAKLVFTHQPSGGRSYSLQVNKMSKVWRIRWDYPINDDGSNPGDDDDDDDKKKKKKKKGKYLGKWKKKGKKKKLKAKKVKKVVGKKDKKGKKDGEKNPKTDKVIKKLTETTGPQKFTFEITGLKPLTDHKLFVFGVNKTAQCRQVNPTDIGVPPRGTLKTDDSGFLDAIFVYNPPAGTKIDNNDYELDEEEMQDLGITVINNDGTSMAGANMTRKKHNEEDLIKATKKRKDKKKKD